MKLFWIDLETTGLNPRVDKVLEIHVSTADLARPFDVTDHGTKVLAFDHMKHAPLPLKVLLMHAKNGLLEEAAEPTAWLAEKVDHWLNSLVRMGPDDPSKYDYDDRPIIAGSSAHFDLAFIREHFPLSAKWFSHRVYDVSAIKLFCRSLGMSKLPRAEAHRARADVYESIDHARQCAAWLTAIRKA